MEKYTVIERSQTKYFRKEKGKYYFHNPVTDTDMEMTIESNGELTDIFFGTREESFAKVVLGDVLGYKTINDFMRHFPGEPVDDDDDEPITEMCHFGTALYLMMIYMVDRMLSHVFGDKQADAESVKSEAE